ncbi:TadE/TadG family type IV pilus assembly protein [Sulfitobacter guttiformis]|nr:TadE family protein [Sulfitobacter guttiformis]
MKKALRQFGKKEDGSAIVFEFMIMVPLVFGVFFMALELGMYSIRQMLLDRSVDRTAREIRINTSANITHDSIKNMICENSGGLTNCASQLRLEMIVVDPRNFAGLPERADCIDTALDPRPVRGFTPGQRHNLMMLRACYNFSPIFPTTGLGFAYAKNSDGKAAMSTISAFVQEPS